MFQGSCNDIAFKLQIVSATFFQLFVFQLEKSSLLFIVNKKNTISYFEWKFQFQCQLIVSCEKKFSITKSHRINPLDRKLNELLIYVNKTVSLYINNLCNPSSLVDKHLKICFIAETTNCESFLNNDEMCQQKMFSTTTLNAA